MAYVTGDSTATIGLALGVDAKSVASELKSAGVKLRSRNGWVND